MIAKMQGHVNAGEIMQGKRDTPEVEGYDIQNKTGIAGGVERDDKSITTSNGKKWREPWSRGEIEGNDERRWPPRAE
jgi:hypothetical protein